MKINLDCFDNNFDSDMSVEYLTKENDRFELLSAYIDGEVTVSQKEQVQEWLNDDPSFQELHQRLLRLNHGFQSLPTPVATQSSAQITHAVFERVESHRWQKVAFWGGTAIAALTVGLVSLFMSENRNPIPQVAETPMENTAPIAVNENPASEASLMIAVNRPPFPIPKAPEASNQNKQNENSQDQN